MNTTAIGVTVARKLANETGLQVEYSHLDLQKDQNVSYDGRLTIAVDTRVVALPAEVKRNVRNSSIPFLRNRHGDMAPWVLLADYLSQPLQQTLRANRINYADAAGNVYLNHPHMFMLVEGKKKPMQELVKSRFRAAETAALMSLLIRPDILNQSYRKLEGVLGTSKATLSALFSMLKEGGYVEGEPGGYRFRQCVELLKEIAPLFCEVVKPRLLLQRFRFAKANGPATWMNWNLPAHIHWSGEAAAHLMDNGYFLPEEWTMYTSLPVSGVMRWLPVVPDSDGPICVYSQFWPRETDPAEKTLVAPCALIYADLVGSGIGRNQQVAQRIPLHLC